MFLPSTKIALINEICRLSNYTKKEIEDIYKKYLSSNSNRNKYYLKKWAIRQLQAIYLKIKKWWNQTKN